MFCSADSNLCGDDATIPNLWCRRRRPIRKERRVRWMTDFLLFCWSSAGGRRWETRRRSRTIRRPTRSTARSTTAPFPRWNWSSWRFFCSTSSDDSRSPRSHLWATAATTSTRTTTTSSSYWSSFWRKSRKYRNRRRSSWICWCRCSWFPRWRRNSSTCTWTEAPNPPAIASAAACNEDTSIEARCIPRSPTAPYASRRISSGAIFLFLPRRLRSNWKSGPFSNRDSSWRVLRWLYRRIFGTVCTFCTHRSKRRRWEWTRPRRTWISKPIRALEFLAYESLPYFDTFQYCLRINIAFKKVSLQLQRTNLPAMRAIAPAPLFPTLLGAACEFAATRLKTAAMTRGVIFRQRRDNCFYFPSFFLSPFVCTTFLTLLRVTDWELSSTTFYLPTFLVMCEVTEVREKTV